jgi:hypothetical protein
MELTVHHIHSVLNVRARPAPGGHPLQIALVKTNYQQLFKQKVTNLAHKS